MAWVSGRHDLLVTIFALAALLTVDRLRRGPEQWWPILVAPVWYLMALFSKESGFALLALLPAWSYLVPGDADRSVPVGRRRAAGLAAGLVVATSIYLVLRNLAGVASEARWTTEPAESTIRLLRTLGYYLVKSVVPPPQTQYVELSQLPSLGLSLLVLSLGAAGGIDP